MDKWIPTAIMKPNPGDCLIVTVWDTFKHRRELRYPVYYRQSYYSDNYGFYSYGEHGGKLLSETVLAWMKLPNPYDDGSAPK